MKLQSDFTVDAPIGDVWGHMLDIERVVVCVPGARLTETVDEDNYKGQLTLKLGPVKLSFAGKVKVAERDEVAHTLVLKGQGTEQKGKGAAQATITVAVTEEAPGGTKVAVTQDLQVSGQAAQLSRGMMQDVSAKLTRQFAECLEGNITAGSPASRAPATEREPADRGPVPSPAGGPGSSSRRTAPDEISVASVGAGALWASIKRFFGRLLKRTRSDR